MKCRKCKQNIPKGNRFCPHCGAGMKKSGAKWVLPILAVAIFGIGIAGTLAYFKIADIPIVSSVVEKFGAKDDRAKSDSDAAAESSAANTDTDESNRNIEDVDNTSSADQYSVEHPDADEYYQKNSKVQSEEKASESSIALAESEAYEYLKPRGFEDCSITTSYSITGEYTEAKNISSASSEKHPMYETIYTSQNGEIWSITIVGNVVTAFPIVYNSEQNEDNQVMLSEKDYMVAYDSEKDKFYITVPYENVLQLKTVTIIDANTLEKLTSGDIDKL